MEILGIGVVVVVAWAFFTRGVPDLHAADAAVERAKAQAGQADSFGPWDFAAVVAKVVLTFLVVVTLAAALLGVALMGVALMGGAL